MISVILPVRDAMHTLGDQLAALARQRFNGRWELVVADNGSTDGSRELALDWCDRLPMTLIDASPVVGAAATRNLAASNARGELLVWCDADDVVDPTWLAAMATAAQSHDFIAGAMDYFSLNQGVPEWKRRMRSAPVECLGRQPYADSANMAVSRKAFDSVNGFDPSLASFEDADLSFRLLLAGYRLHFESNALVAKRMRRGVAATWRQSSQWGRDEVRLYKRYRGRAAAGGAPIVRGDRVGGIRAHLQRLPASFRGGGATAWLEFVARHYGRVQGSLRERTLLI